MIRFAAGLLAIFLVGCGTTWKARGDAVAVGPKDSLYVLPPEVSDIVEARLAVLGWGDGRFETELRKELQFQFQRRRVPMSGDSAAGASTLEIHIESYGGRPVPYRGVARLRKEGAERVIEIGKGEGQGKGGAQELERPDPTVDHIRAIAESVVSGALKASQAKRAKDEPPIHMWMIF